MNNPSISAANNRLTSAGYSHDAAGNLLCDPARQCVQGPSSLTPYYSYDAESRMRWAGGGYDSGGTTYSYDGEGRRVRKATAGGEVTVFVYDAAGRVVAEYSNRVERNGTQYLTADSLGSTRVVTDKDGGVKSRHDYLPFGEEVPGDATWRTDGGGYQADAVRQKFTGYERDSETGLDYAQARYYANAQGRFTSADPLMASARPAAPQTWNRYAYALNNPLGLTDPTGLAPQNGGHIRDSCQIGVDAGCMGGPDPSVTVTASANEPITNTELPIVGFVAATPLLSAAEAGAATTGSSVLAPAAAAVFGAFALPLLAERVANPIAPSPFMTLADGTQAISCTAGNQAFPAANGKGRLASVGSGVPLQRLVWGKGGRGALQLYAATPNRLATNFAGPAESLPSNLFTCPFRIMCKDSTPSSVRSAL